MKTNHLGIILPASSVAKRDIPAASSAHCTVFGVLGDGDGVRIQGESWLEHRNQLLLNAKENVMELAEQEEFQYGYPGELYLHYFDVVATLTCGRRIAYTVKPEIRLHSRSGKKDENGERLDDRTFLEKMSNITWWATVETETYDEVRLVTEADINQTDLRNARMFAAVREPDAEADAAALAVAMGLPSQGGRSLRDLTIETGMQARGYRALIRLMRRGLLRPIAHEVIRPLTVVRFSPRP